MFLREIQSGKKIYIIAASVLGFLASGGSLNITALNCGIYLLITCLGIRVYQKKKISLICFISALSGGVNAVAPGNFIRHGVDSYPIFSALSVAVYYAKREIQEILFGSPFILLLCIFFILMLKKIRNPRPVKGRHLVIFAVFIILGVIIVYFLVCLGYIVDYFPDRCIWVQNCVIYFGTFSWVACLAEWVKGRYGDLEIKKETMICFLVSCILYGCNLCAVRDISTYPTVDMVKQLVSGDIADYADYWEGVLEEIEYSEDDEVIVYRDAILNNDFVLWPNITSDKDFEMNRGIADYYGKEWVYITTDM